MAQELSRLAARLEGARSVIAGLAQSRERAVCWAESGAASYRQARQKASSVMAGLPPQTG